MNIPAEIKNHPDFNKNQRKFFGIDNADTKSEWNRNINKFFGANPADAPKNMTAGNTIGEKFINVQTNIQVDPSTE